jgi:hypothetical protein
VKLPAKLLSSFSQSRCKIFPLESHFEATRKDPDPKKIPRAYFDLLNLCAKFQSHSTGSTSNPGVKTTPNHMYDLDIPGYKLQ